MDKEIQIKRIAIKSATKIDFIAINEIICCKAEDNYTSIYLVNNKKITVSKPLKHFDGMLSEEAGFYRVDKSSFVNLNFVESYLKDKDIIVLENSVEVTVSRRRKKEFLDKFKTL